MEDFKRPNHPDFMDSSELKKKKWSGIRHNTISGDLECWVEGEIVFCSTLMELSLDANNFQKKYGEYFGFYNEAQRNIAQ